MFRYLFLALLFLLPACGAKVYEEAKPGAFHGSLLVMWVDANAEKPTGDGRFVYVPDTGAGNGLTFTRGVSVDGDKVHVKEIAPGWMYTDGGSIPRLAQPFRGLNPWGYAPAYMVHDWIFAARKCLNDEMASDDEKKMASVTFKESYAIIAEAIKTLEATNKVSGSDVQPGVITSAVASPITRALWDSHGQCQRISDAHRRQIEARLGGGQRTITGLTIIDGEVVTPAKVVAQVSF